MELNKDKYRSTICLCGARVVGGAQRITKVLSFINTKKGRERCRSDNKIFTHNDMVQAYLTLMAEEGAGVCISLKGGWDDV